MANFPFSFGHKKSSGPLASPGIEPAATPPAAADLQAQLPYREMIWGSPDPIIIMDLKGFLLFVNRAAEEISRYPAKDLIGKHFTQLGILSGPSLKKSIQAFTQIVSTEQSPPPFDVDIVRKDGGLITMEVNPRLIKSNEKNFGIQVNFRDTTTRRQIDSQMRLLTHALEAAANGIIISNLDGTVLWVNPAFTELTGYVSGDIIGKSTRILKSGQHSREFYAEMWKTIKAGRVWRGEILNRRKDGSLYFEEMSITPVLNEWGKISNFIAIKQDVTARKHSEEKLINSEKKFRDLVSNLQVGVVRTTVHNPGKVLEINRFTAEMFGHDSIEQMMDIPVQDFYWDPRDRAQLVETLLVEGSVQSCEVKFRKKNGAPLWTLLSAELHHDESNAPAWIDTVLQDITLLKQAEEKLRSTQQQLMQSEKMAAIGTLASGVAHEVKNPLNLILMTMAELETRVGASDERAAKLLKIIQSSAERTSKVVAELLQFSRTSEIKLEALNPAEIVESALLLVQSTARKKPIQFHKEFDGASGKVRGDKLLLEQVFCNLFINAIDAIEYEGTITVRLRPGLSSQGERIVEAEVADNGPGISPEIAQRIFEPFFTTKEAGKGTGLGLSTVYMILQRHNGSIEVKSQPGQGAAFTIRLPAAKE